jgi:signal transduction histidine kinase/ActR/RegA family two-component response regulator
MDKEKTSGKKKTPQAKFKEQAEEYESRIRYLEQVNRLTLDALDQAARLGDFQTSINQMDSPAVILEKTQARIRSLIPFQAVSFYLVHEEESEFYLADCRPGGFSRFIKAEVENYIANGTFAWAIREQRPIFVPTIDHTKKILLHVLTTASRVRGMFVGVLTYGEMEVPLVSLSLMSIILRHSSNALESFELYGMIRTINKDLEKVIQERTRELQSSQEQLRHALKMEALGRLAGGVAHDFNNILTAITIASEISLQQPGLPEMVNKNFDDILNAAERASNLTRQLLAVSRRQVIHPKLLDVKKVVADISKLLSHLIPEDIELEVECEDFLNPIKADPSQVEQVLINLAVNAQDAIGEHQDPFIEKKISIGLMGINLGAEAVEQDIVTQPGEYILIRFTDTGIGMDMHVKEKIFDPFFTTKEEGKGSGLGLATVYGITKQNQGGITVKSTPKKGTTFNIYWPCAAPADEAAPGAPPISRVTGGEETILLVEDDEGIRNAVGQLLTSLGYEVISAVNGKDALDKAKNHPGAIDLLLTDITMPKMDGKQLAKSLKQKMPGLKIIFTTGYSHTAQDADEMFMPDSWFIQKPYSISDITEIIRKLLDTTDTTKEV